MSRSERPTPASASNRHYLRRQNYGDDESADNDDDGDDDGYPAHSHHDKIPPWWRNVSNDKGGNMSVTKSHHT